MNILLLIISSVFSGIFFVFHKLSVGERFFGGYKTHVYELSSLSGNLLIETMVFLTIGVFLCFYFTSLSVFSLKKIGSKENNDESIPEETVKKVSSFSILTFFKKYVYYLGFLLFYFSVYLFLKSLGIDNFGSIILFLNIVIGCFFFLTKKSELFRDFIRINTILFSLYYIVLYFFIVLLGMYGVGIIDSINTVSLLSFFLITFYTDSKIHKSEETDPSMVLYFFIYSFIVFSFYGKILLSGLGIDFIQVFIYLGVGFNIFIYFFLSRVSFFQNSLYILRGLSFIFLYISVISCFVYLYRHVDNFSFVHIFIIGNLVYSSVFNFFIHRQFLNYVSLLFCLTGAVVLLLYLGVKSMGTIIYLSIQEIIIILFFTIAFSLIIYTYSYRQTYLTDYYFIHIYAYVLQFIGVGFYLFNTDIDYSKMSIILLLESVFIFISYFQLRKIGKEEA